MRSRSMVESISSWKSIEMKALNFSPSQYHSGQVEAAIENRDERFNPWKSDEMAVELRTRMSLRLAKILSILTTLNFVLPIHCRH